MAAALLFVLVLRALVPVGFMLAPSALDPGSLVLTICPSNAGRLISVPARADAHHGHDHRHHHDHDSPAGLDHQMCGFAVASVSDVPPGDHLTLPAVPAPAVTLARTVGDLVTPPARVGSPLGSRAPSTSSRCRPQPQPTCRWTG